MNVFINNKPFHFAEASHLAAVLKEAGLASQRGIAVAVNNSVVSKSNWDQYLLKEEDKITIITATQGG